MRHRALPERMKLVTGNAVYGAMKSIEMANLVLKKSHYQAGGDIL